MELRLRFEQGRCNIPPGSLIDDFRIAAGLPEPRLKTHISSPFDGSPTWNCAEPVTTLIVQNPALVDGDPRQYVCRLHAAAHAYGVEHDLDKGPGYSRTFRLKVPLAVRAVPEHLVPIPRSGT